MQKDRRDSFLAALRLRGRLLLLVILATFPAFGIILHASYEERQIEINHAENQALLVLRSLSAAQEHRVTASHQLLEVLVELSVVRGQDAGACRDLLAHLLKRYPHYANFSVIEKDGFVFSSAGSLEEDVNLVDRSHFRRVVETRDFAVGDYRIGRVTGESTVDFGHPVLDEAGQVSRVVFASLRLTWIDHLAREAKLPAGSTVTVLDGRGTVLMHYPDPEEKWVGRSLPDSDLARTMAASGGKTSSAWVRGLDGRLRLYAFQPESSVPGGNPVYLAVGIPKEIALKRADLLLVRNLGGLIAVFLFALTVAWFLGHTLIGTIQERLTRLAITDDLTGLNNRRGFIAHAEQHWKLAARTRRGFLLFMMDMDGFKQINDRFGHAEGDRALQSVADALRETFRTSDIVARIGGDEFAVLAIESGQDSIPLILERLQKRLEGRVASSGYRLSVSAGFSSFDPGSPLSVDQLMAAADGLLYQRKRERGLKPGLIDVLP